jgi:hypothetical protein
MAGGFMVRVIASFAIAFVLLTLDCAFAQEGGGFQLGGQVSFVNSSEFDTTDTGFGARVAWNPAALIGVEAEMTFYPDDLGVEGAAFSRGRVEGLFGMTVGPVIGSVRPFAKVRPGFVTFQEAPGPIACILIFPPPLSCTLAAGKTMFAFDIGGGLELFPATRMFVRLDVGDRMVRYPGPVIARDGIEQEDFFSHDFRFAIGAGVRF